MSDFGQFAITYKRSLSADRVRNEFGNVFDAYAFDSTDLRVFDIDLPDGGAYIFSTDPKKTVQFCMVVLRDTNPLTLRVDYTTEPALLANVELVGLPDSVFPKPEDTSGSFCVLPTIRPGTTITLNATNGDVGNATLYIVEA